MRKVAAILLVFLSATILSNAVAQPANDIGLPQISAHRGASRVAPENTIASFRKAIESGANFIEIDVRTTADGEQVIVHDRSLKRTTGLNAKVDETDYNSIRPLSAGKWFGNSFSVERIPTLEEVCQLVSKTNQERKKVMLYVDCKSINPSKVVSTLKKYELLDSAVFYGEIETLKELRNLFAKARLMPSFPSKEEADEVMEAIRPYAFDVPFEKLDQETITYIHGKNIKVFSDLFGDNDHPIAYRRQLSTESILFKRTMLMQCLEPTRNTKTEGNETVVFI